MTEDFQVKQSSSNSGAYGLTGGIIGGLGAGIAANHFTKPKYGSYEDIIKEAKDSADFKSKIDKAEGDDKKFLEDARTLNEKRTSAEAEYDKLFEEYKKVNGKTKVETDAYKELVKAEEEANTALVNKKNELINKEIARIKEAGTGNKTATIGKSLKHKAVQIFYATKHVNELQAKGASKEEIASATARVEALQKEAEELSAKIAEKLDYGKLTDEALANKKNEVANAYKLNIQDRVNQQLRVYDKPVVEPEFVTLSKDFMANRKAIEAQNEALKAAEKEIQTLTCVDIEAFAKSAHDHAAPRKIQTIVDYEQRHIDKLNVLKEAYAKATESAGKTGEFSFATLLENLKKLGTPGATFEAGVVDVQKELTKYLTDTKGLTKEQQAAIKKLVNGEINEKNIQEAIDKATTRVNDIKTAVKKAIAAEDKLEELAEKTNALKEKMNEKGVYVREKDGVVIDKKTKEPAVSKVTKAPKEEPPKIKLPKGVKVPDDVKIEYQSKAAAELSEEEIKKQAEAAVKENAYKTEKEAAEAAKSAREAAYGKLEDGVAKSEEEIKKAFNESLKVTDKNAYADGKVSAAKKEFLEKYAEKMKRKWGFAEHTNWKIAGAAAAGALVLGGIFSALAPKKD